MFETETMAELCLRQGLVRDALLIYRRLLASAADEPTRARHARRVAELEQPDREASRVDPAEPAGTSATELQEQHDDQQVTLRWRLPSGTPTPALQILVLRRDASGIAAERSTVRLAQAQGSLTLPIAGVHSVRAAAGKLDGERFVPLVRLKPVQAE
ncbi:MAG TPA: hypothetical protein VFH68_08095 [Polyangia bacterium]|jgi:hypothetical protein|nr:hypothetical protein [Polyangia bacterium]